MRVASGADLLVQQLESPAGIASRTSAGDLGGVEDFGNTVVALVTASCSARTSPTTRSRSGDGRCGRPPLPSLGLGLPQQAPGRHRPRGPRAPGGVRRTPRSSRRTRSAAVTASTSRRPAARSAGPARTTATRSRVPPAGVVVRRPAPRSSATRSPTTAATNFRQRAAPRACGEHDRRQRRSRYRRLARTGRAVCGPRSPRPSARWGPRDRAGGRRLQPRGSARAATRAGFGEARATSAVRRAPRPAACSTCSCRPTPTWQCRQRDAHRRRRGHDRILCAAISDYLGPGGPGPGGPGPGGTTYVPQSAISLPPARARRGA